MTDYLSDEELDSLFDEPQQQQPRQIMPVEEYPPPQPVPLYSLQLANANLQANGHANGQAAQPIGQVQPGEGLLLKKLGPLPVWSWGLIALGVTTSGYFAYKAMKGSKPKANGEEESSTPKIGEMISKALAANTSDSSGSSWEPSRSGFADRLSAHFQKKNQSQHVKVWHDAEDAQRSGMKHLSPLINIQVKHGSVKLDQALTRFCRREGLNPRQHPDGSIGLYPHTSKRGKEWEEYIDALRDDGQQI